MQTKASNILEKYAGAAMKERARWIDSTIEKALPEWKLKIMRKYPYPILARLLLINIEIENVKLIANFGTRVEIKLNGKLIGKRNFE